jgi:voltage-gated potassium channel
MKFTLSFIYLFFSDILQPTPVVGFLLLLVASIGLVIGREEGWSTSAAIYHAFINATTVGYGDFRPSKKVSKALAILLALVGLVLTGMIVAIALHAANFAFAQAYGVAGFGRQP